MNTFEPPAKSSEPITETAKRIRERRRNEQGVELWGILVMLVVGGLVAALFAARI